MTMTQILASVAVRQLDPAVEWYERVFGPATSRPMPEVAEWHLPGGGGLQVYELPERAGRGSFTVAVTDIDEQAAGLAAAGIPDATPNRGSTVEAIMVKDPDGNSIAFAHPVEADRSS
jgi:catechol 2,3-dioxygenase-like lactoylglutathione lyase family enzyme